MSEEDDLYKQCDINCDGKMNYDEFVSAAINHKSKLTEQNLRKAFNLFDINGDGHIDANEFKILLPPSNFSNHNQL